MSTELLSCPFCGGEPVLTPASDTDPTLLWPGCPACDVWLESVGAWNRRARPTGEPAEGGEREGWRPIETAPKDGDADSLTESVLLGFAPDEEGFSPTAREGFWHTELQCWASALSPDWRDGPQPTHWQPLPEAPRDA